MPRPGPRPYECVRRAWHSDRHQPIRGSLIQQIFRVVTEAHSSTTRKNREWQEKLPRVVLKAEEIMYSKANSEGEYTDPETLWERLNDAVDTIIRRDESTETGQFLQPCIEAALVLGCVPVRASRSQRHSNPRSYLSPSFQEPAHAAPAVPDKTTNPGTPPQTATPSSNYLSMPMTMEVKQSVSFPFTGSQIAPINSFMANHAGPNLPPCFPRPMPPVASEANSSLDLRTVYPLYHGSHFQNVQPQFRFQSRQTSNPENIIIGRPVSWHGVQRSCSSSTRNLLPGERVGTEADKHELVKEVDSCGKAVELDCDLSLRLGPSEPSVEKHLAYLKKDGGSSSHQGISKNSDPYINNHEISFFPMCNANDPSHSCTSKMELEDEAFDMNTTFRKRKAADHCEIEEESTQWVSKLQHNQFYGQCKWPGHLQTWNRESLAEPLASFLL